MNRLVAFTIMSQPVSWTEVIFTITGIVIIYLMIKKIVEESVLENST